MNVGSDAKVRFFLELGKENGKKTLFLKVFLNLFLHFHNFTYL